MRSPSRMPAGSDQTRAFYDSLGWREEDGVTTDRALFGVREDGPVRRRLHAQRIDRIRRVLASVSEHLRFLEAGCGGNPETAFLDLCSGYTGVDFSETGLELARTKLPTGTFRYADICSLPFDDGAFDAVYSAHVIYHLPDSAAQRRALGEMARVTCSGGVVVVLAANPHPLLFPGRLARRLIAEAPLLRQLADAIRRKPPVPYLPLGPDFFREALTEFGNVDVSCYALMSTWANQHVSERGPGRLVWKAVEALERRPSEAMRLGCYVQVVLRRR